MPVPLTATFCVVAPVLAFVMFPLFVPVLVGAKRTKMVVVATVPLEGVSVTDEPKPLPLVVET